DDHTVFHVLRGICVRVHDDTILEIHAGAERDARQIAAHYNPKPEVSATAEDDIPSHYGRAGDVEVPDCMHGSHRIFQRGARMGYFPQLIQPFYNTKSPGETITLKSPGDNRRAAGRRKVSEHADYAALSAGLSRNDRVKTSAL